MSFEVERPVTQEQPQRFTGRLKVCVAGSRGLAGRTPGPRIQPSGSAGMASLGVAWPGPAWQAGSGLARLGWSRHGWSWQAGLGSSLQGVAGHGLAGKARHGPAPLGSAGLGMACQGRRSAHK